MLYVNECAVSGLRTLLLTRRNISEEEYAAWNSNY